MSAQARYEQTTPEVSYADPHNERFAIHTMAHTLESWREVNRPQDVADYHPDELSLIRHRIRRAARGHELEIGD